MTESANKPDAVNPAIASRFAFVHHWRGVTDPGRSVKSPSANRESRGVKNMGSERWTDFLFFRPHFSDIRSVGGRSDRAFEMIAESRIMSEYLTEQASRANSRPGCSFDAMPLMSAFRHFDCPLPAAVAHSWRYEWHVERS